jgi:aspartate racemase
MYTSGSTGRPKGVSVTHQGVVRLLQGVSYVALTAGEIFLQLAPISFDASTFEIWACLLHGARLAIMPPSLVSLEDIGQAIERYRVTTLWLTAGLFHLMVEQRLQALTPVRQLLAGGDVLSVPHVLKYLREPGTHRLINGYGPTENTTFTCCYVMSDPSLPANTVPIGRPIANTRVYILNRALQPVPIGVAGDLYIGGDGLARSYLARPALTAEMFIPDPHSAEAGSYLYKTGDLARFLPDGNLEFLGRVDHQVKIRGFRIEPDEIASVLAAHPRVHETVVTVRGDETGDKRLVAYVVPHAQPEEGMATHDAAPGAQDIIALLRAYLQVELPDYMMPSAFVLLEALPLTPNGKVDRQSLPDPDSFHTQREVASAMPQTAVEQQLTAIWQDVLNLDQVGVYENFFDLGGHSLLLVQIRSKVHDLYGRAPSMLAMFRYPTIHDLAKHLSQEGDEGPAAEPIATQGSDARKASLDQQRKQRQRRLRRQQHRAADRR